MLINLATQFQFRIIFFFCRFLVENVLSASAQITIKFSQLFVHRLRKLLLIRLGFVLNWICASDWEWKRTKMFDFSIVCLLKRNFILNRSVRFDAFATKRIHFLRFGRFQLFNSKSVSWASLCLFSFLYIFVFNSFRKWRKINNQYSMEPKIIVHLNRNLSH